MRRLVNYGLATALTVFAGAAQAGGSGTGHGAWGGRTHMTPPGGGMHMPPGGGGGHMPPRPGGGMHMPPPQPGGHGSGGHWSGTHWGGGHWSGGRTWFGSGWRGGSWNGGWNGGWAGAGYGGGHGGANGWDRYYRPTRGYRLSAFWLSPTYYVSDWGNYGLTAPGNGYRWVRYYDDAVLIDERGNIMDARYGLDWGPRGSAGKGPRLDYDTGYDDGYDDGYSDASADSAPRLGGGADGRYAFSNGSVIYAAPGVTTVVVQSAPVVTTTTTYEDVVYRPVKSKWRSSHRATRQRPHCDCK